MCDFNVKFKSLTQLYLIFMFMSYSIQYIIIVFYIAAVI